MIKYRLHNTTNFGVEIHDFDTESALNNYIALIVRTPYWVEKIETNENTSVYSQDKLDIDNVSRETLHESEIDWIKRHTPLEEEKDSCTKLEKIFSFLAGLSIIIMSAFLLYILLSSVSFIAEYFSQFTWKAFNIL